MTDVYDFDFGTYVQRYRAAAEELRKLTVQLAFSHTPSLVDLMGDALQNGLERLDRLPRTDPFWLERNHLATRYKLQELFRLKPDDLALAWADLAFSAVGASSHLPRHPIWKILHDFPIEWLLEAGWILFANSGQQTSTLPMAASIGRKEELVKVLNELTQSQTASVREWAAREITGYEN